MSWSWNSHSLPFLPGNTFKDVTKTEFHRPQTLGYRNGFALSHRPTVGIGKDPLLSEHLLQQQIKDLSLEMPDGTYVSFDNRPQQKFIPGHVAFDKKMLRFYAYFVEDILYSPEEQYRVRPVVIYYYLEDDSMRIIEPAVENAGIPQGTRVKRHRLPKNDHGEFYEWKDLNVAMNLKVYEVKYRITQCDEFTREFLESEGIIVNDPEEMPADPYIKHREKPRPTYKTPSEYDSVYQFLTMDRKVLRFFAMWEDVDGRNGVSRPVTIQYYLVDDTVEIRDVQVQNSGWDPFPVLLRRQRLPKKIKKEPSTFPSCVLEVSPEEVQEFYSPKDFKVGQPIMLLGHRFQLYDCDGFTKEFYQQNHPDIEIKALEPPKKTEKVWRSKKEIPPYNGFGSVEDSMQNCLSLIPKRPKRNIIQLLENDHKVLRYSAKLDSQNPTDEGRRFILSYYLCDDMISIFEKPTHNSGIMGGKFLEKARILKPGYNLEKPQFYRPADFSIGSTVEVFKHRFVLTNADRYVLTYLESIASQIPAETLESLRKKLQEETDAKQLAEQTGETQPAGK